MKSAFYIELNSFKNKIDWDNLDIGNPGIGGTQYLFIMTVYYLKQDKNDVCLLSDCSLKTSSMEIIDVKDGEGAVEFCTINGIDNLIVNAYGNDWVFNNRGIYENKINLFLWAHNAFNYAMKKRIIAGLNTPQVICVSEQQFKNMKDSSLSGITDYVNNFITSRFWNEATVSSLSKKQVIYIGALLPNKGCHNLIKIWKYVIKAVPDAELIVIGSSSVYSSKFRKGKLGLTDNLYEKMIMHYVKKLPNQESVKFVGGKSWGEIRKLIKNAKVGVVNVSNFMRDETFCVSAIELQACGLPVVSRKRGDGLETTVSSGKTGFLAKKDEDIANYIVKLLSDDELCRDMSTSARDFSKGFVENSSIQRWVNILSSYKKINKPSSARKDKEDRIRLIDDFKIFLYKCFRRLF